MDTGCSYMGLVDSAGPVQKWLRHIAYMFCKILQRSLLYTFADDT